MASQPHATFRPTCILNGKSVHLQMAIASIASVSGEFGVEAKIIVTNRGDDIGSLAADALSDNRQPVVAGGGDGTVNAVANRLAGTDMALGVLPMGTLNHFAKDVGIPLALEAAVRNLFTGHVIKVDVGEVNGRIFVNNSGVGFYPHFVRQREEQQRRGYPKRVAFMLALRAVMRRYFRLRIRVHMDQAKAIEQVTPFLFVGNNRYQTSGLEVGTRSKLDSGRLWVCTAPNHGRGNIVPIVLKTLAGRVGTDQEVNSFEAEELWVQPGTARVNVSTDGEVSTMNAPLHFKIRPRALSVIVPEDHANR